ncbi:MAG TPA: Ppx/GppA phosphatase family protein [Candidatus Dormibacteraeota bacterium]|nr:Ppx/GppA phosphatase family protein [Candidatus Dormibacteraeota bacterium]
MRLGVLDIGSNTAHLSVVEGSPDGDFRPVANRRAVLKLAEAAFPSLEIPEEAEERLVATVRQMRAVAAEHRVSALVAFATSAIREATNGMAVLGRLREATGVPVRVLPGVDEARLTYLAARTWATFSARRLLVLDIGGGSLEVAGGAGEHPEIADSLPLGATRLTRRFVRSDPPDEAELAALRVHVLGLLGPLAERVREQDWDVVCATSKTFRTLANVAERLPDAPSPSASLGFAGIDGRTAPVLNAETVNLVAGRLARTTKRERGRLKGLDRLRANNVVAGSQIAALAMQAFGLRRLVLAPWALREGVIIDYLRREAGSGEDEGRDHPGQAAVVAFARRYAWDEPHARRVTELALSLFDQTFDLHGLGPAERDLLSFAGLLHDVGAAVAQSAHHKHSLYIISNAEIEGLTQRELRLIANIARYHRKALPSDHHVEYMALDDEDRRLVRRLGALLRLADGLDLDHFQLVESARLSGTGETLTLELHARDEPGLALWAVERLSDLFEMEFRRKIRAAVVQPA